MRETFEPSIEEFKNICDNNNFTVDQVNELKSIIWRTHLKVGANASSAITGVERKRILSLLKKFHVSLDQLLWALGVTTKDFKKLSEGGTIRFETDMGVKATSRLVAAATGRKKLKVDPMSDLMPFAARGIEGVGDDLLRVKQSVDFIVEVTVKDRGGKPADLVRNYLVMELCKSSRKLIGRAPASSAKGKFVSLVDDVVVVCCKLKRKGLVEVIERNISLLKMSK
jgi:hypothetical protein